MAASTKTQRSGCPVSIALELLGDRWTLLVLRDLIFRGPLNFAGFVASPEGIAPNILSERLDRLQDAGLIVARRDEADRRRIFYDLTARGIDTVDIVLAAARWSIAHEPARIGAEALAALSGDHPTLARQLRRDWGERQNDRQREKDQT